MCGRETVTEAGNLDDSPTSSVIAHRRCRSVSAMKSRSRRTNRNVQTNDRGQSHELNEVFHSSIFDQGIMFTPTPSNFQLLSIQPAHFHCSAHPFLKPTTQRISKLTQPNNQISLLFQIYCTRSRSVVNVCLLTKHSKSLYP
jgi:hypothetical protein